MAPAIAPPAVKATVFATTHWSDKRLPPTTRSSLRAANEHQPRLTSDRGSARRTTGSIDGRRRWRTQGAAGPAQLTDLPPRGAWHPATASVQEGGDHGACLLPNGGQILRTRWSPERSRVSVPLTLHEGDVSKGSRTDQLGLPGKTSAYEALHPPDIHLQRRLSISDSAWGLIPSARATEAWV
jgi:hypothetical protein